MDLNSYTKDTVGDVESARYGISDNGQTLRFRRSGGECNALITYKRGQRTHFEES